MSVLVPLAIQVIHRYMKESSTLVFRSLSSLQSILYDLLELELIGYATDTINLLF